MATTPVFEFTLPVRGDKVRWSPLTVGKEMEIEANYRDAANAHMRKYARYARRILAVGDKQGCETQDLREWEVLDLNAFAEEVEAKETARALAFAKPTSQLQPLQDLNRAIDDARSTLTALSQAMEALSLSARAAEAAGVPLAPPSVS